MSESDQSNLSEAALVDRVAATSLRMMAGTVPSHVVDHLQSRLYARPDAYPWDEVVDTILAEPVEPNDLVNKGIISHRNWLLRGGRSGQEGGRGSSSGGRRTPSLKVRGKTLLAAAIVKSGFFVIYTATVVMVLVLLRHKFPSFDIYRILDGLREALPSIFAR